MSGCEKKCEREKLYAAYLQLHEKASFRTTAERALEKLEEYAAGRDMKLCAISVTEMREFVIGLRSLEQEGHDPKIISHWISLISFFYDYLISEGCLEENSMRILKAQEIEKLLKHMAERGYTRQDLGGGDEEG